MGRPDNGKLHWTNDRGEAWRAWAPRLYPDDKMVPFYRISRVTLNQSVRIVELHRPAAGAPPERVGTGTTDNLKEAKRACQQDYEKRQEK